MYYSSFLDGFYQTFLICGAIYAFVFAAETIFNGVIFGSFFGIAYFTVDRIVKFADDQIKLNRKLVSQLKDCKKELSQCEEKLSQCKESLN